MSSLACASIAHIFLHQSKWDKETSRSQEWRRGPWKCRSRAGMPGKELALPQVLKAVTHGLEPLASKDLVFEI